MTYDPKIHHRRSIRLRGYDYAQAGAYFVTVCVHEGRHLLGAFQDGELQLHEPGEIVTACWQDLVRHYPHVILDEFVVMPNHVHGIIVLSDVAAGVGAPIGVGAGLRPAPTGVTNEFKRHGVPEIVRAFKSFSARRINALRGIDHHPVWQRNYYEHIIRDGELDRIREYVRTNPLRWACDRYNPAQGVIIVDEHGRMLPWEEQ